MTIMFEGRGWSQGLSQGNVCLSDKFEVIKDIGDGSFGSVALARVRGAGAHVAKRGTMVAIKTMKKTFESFAACLELREIIFLRTLPNHPHLVPALDIFLDPLSRKLHIAMEYMDGNLYQLIKARDHKSFDGTVVKSILVQILSGLEHIHQHEFFHRDIKPENILVSVSAREDFGSAFKRYSQIMTPPSTPPSYTIKIADFGLAREIHSKTPYTTYVSTRWYRAPEVLLRAGEYSAPVDMWAIGAMAVEIALLKPLFPGGNEVDQVWRVCEIMGSPGHWVNKHDVKVGGGPWRAGVKLAQKLGFSFPKMTPITLDTILRAPEWPAELCDFVTWCLMWDPNGRPTATEALNHAYFSDAVDPLLSKPAPRLLSRKQSDSNLSNPNYTGELVQPLSTKSSSWFRKSLLTRESAPAVTQHVPSAPGSRPMTPRASPVKADEITAIPGTKPRPKAIKRATWTLSNLTHGAPMPILPSIRPISPFANTVTAQAYAEHDHTIAEGTKKLSRQLSFISQGNQHYDTQRHDLERTLNSDAKIPPAPSGQKEGFFSHLRKRARRISGRHQLPPTPRADDYEANVGCTPWGIGRNAVYPDLQTSTPMASSPNTDFSELDRIMRNIGNTTPVQQQFQYTQQAGGNSSHGFSGVKRIHSMPASQELSAQTDGGQRQVTHELAIGRTRPKDAPSHAPRPYERMYEQEQALDYALANAHVATARLEQQQGYLSQYQLTAATSEHRPPLDHSASENFLHLPYPTPSTSDKRHTIGFGHSNYQPQPLDIHTTKRKSEGGYPFPTPPYEEHEWAAGAAAAIFGAGDEWR